MRRAVLFLILTFAVYAAAQSRGSASSGAPAAPSAGAMPAAGGVATPNVSPGLNGQPASGPASEAPTTNLGPSTAQPLGTGQFTNGSTGVPTSFTNTGGFITNGAFPGGYVPLLQTPEVSFPTGITSVPNNPAGISNLPLGLQYANTSAASTSNNTGIFNTGAADFGMNTSLPSDRSLGEIAREFRSQQSTQRASRVYTNADIARLNQSNGQVSLGSNLGPQSNAQMNPNPAPQSPTTPAVNNHPAQPAQNQNLPGGEAQSPQPR